MYHQRLHLKRQTQLDQQRQQSASKRRNGVKSEQDVSQGLVVAKWRCFNHSYWKLPLLPILRILQVCCQYTVRLVSLPVMRQKIDGYLSNESTKMDDTTHRSTNKQGLSAYTVSNYHRGSFFNRYFTYNIVHGSKTNHWNGTRDKQGTKVHHGRVRRFFTLGFADQTRR
jgi:hypothetical protein